MLSEFKHIIKQYISGNASQRVPVHWIKKVDYSWLAQQFSEPFINVEHNAYSERIELLARRTNRLGQQPLWEGYASRNIAGQMRLPDVVRTAAAVGNVYAWLVRKLQPRLIVEFGTAFGVSGMYFLAGIESNQKGQLLTFEPNEVWRKIAIRNLAHISDRFQSFAGTFENHIDKALQRGQRIDLAFIDAIHTSEFVLPQLEIVIAHSSDRAIIILDDINFSSNMKSCWTRVSQDARFMSCATLGERVGILELDKIQRH